MVRILLNLLFSATEYHLGLLKAKLAKYRSQLLEPSKKAEKGDGFDVLKSGDARVALIGFPSVGKVCSWPEYVLVKLRWAILLYAILFFTVNLIKYIDADRE